MERCNRLPCVAQLVNGKSNTELITSICIVLLVTTNFYVLVLTINPKDSLSTCYHYCHSTERKTGVHRRKGFLYICTALKEQRQGLRLWLLTSPSWGSEPPTGSGSLGSTLRGWLLLHSVRQRSKPPRQGDLARMSGQQNSEGYVCIQMIRR